jgi:hypothetical protein
MAQVSAVSSARQGVDRLIWALLSLGCLGVLSASRWLTPSPSGMGTHTQLGLPPCGFLLLLGAPCPACGLTTSFAHLAHFQLLASLHAHPMGVPLFLGMLALLVLSLRGLVLGTSSARAFNETPVEKLALWLAAGMLLSWAVRLVML